MMVRVRTLRSGLVAQSRHHVEYSGIDFIQTPDEEKRFFPCESRFCGAKSKVPRVVVYREGGVVPDRWSEWQPYVNRKVPSGSNVDELAVYNHLTCRPHVRIGVERIVKKTILRRNHNRSVSYVLKLSLKCILVLWKINRVQEHVRRDHKLGRVGIVKRICKLKVV